MADFWNTYCRTSLFFFFFRYCRYFLMLYKSIFEINAHRKHKRTNCVVSRFGDIKGFFLFALTSATDIVGTRAIIM